jgi:hypothetical protein
MAGTSTNHLLISSPKIGTSLTELVPETSMLIQSSLGIKKPEVVFSCPIPA